MQLNHGCKDGHQVSTMCDGTPDLVGNHVQLTYVLAKPIDDLEPSAGVSHGASTKAYLEGFSNQLREASLDF